MYILSMIILIFFAIIGLCAFISAIIYAAHNTKGDEILIVLRKLNEENAEGRLRKAAGICMNTRDAKLLCVCERDNPAFVICEKFKADYPFIEITNERAIHELFI